MSTINLLFWLLIAFMGGIAWAIEAGLGYRHKSVLASSVLASLASGLIIMFWIEDNTFIDYSNPMAFDKAKRSKSGEKGAVSFGEVEEEGEASAGKGKGGAAKAKDGDGKGKGGATAGTGSKGKDDKDGDVEIDEAKIVYSRVPFRDCPQCPQLVIVPEGNAFAGSEADDKGRTSDEQIQTVSQIAKPFAVGRIEILKSEFQAYAKDTSYVSTTQCNIGSKRRGKFNWTTPAFEQDERHAVTCLTSQEVSDYLAWLGKKSGRTYRLPSETEWEYAARAGTTTPYSTGTAIWRHQGNFGRSRDGTTVAGSFEMNNFGLSDFAGNLWELTSDCRSATTGTPDAVCNRIIKGGGWNTPAPTTRPAARSYLPDGSATNFVGIRVVRDVDERDADKLLTVEQRLAIARDEKLASEIKQREIDSLDKEKREAREAAANAPPPGPRLKPNQKGPMGGAPGPATGVGPAKK